MKDTDDVSDNLKMFGRYAITAGVAYAVGAKWVSPENGELLTDFLIHLGGLLVAFAPAFYAHWKIDNSPKP